MYASKSPWKAILKVSYLENIYFENSPRICKKQKNYHITLCKKERKKYFNNLNPAFLYLMIIFWKTVNPLFSNKCNYGVNVKLTGKNDTQSDDKAAELLNNLF